MMTHIMILAGEASGDLLGANLASALQNLNTSQHLNTPLLLTGMGGEQMQQQGVEIFCNMTRFSAVGASFIKHIGSLWHAKNLFKQKIKQQRPDLLVLIDYPDFNLRIAKIAKQANIKVLFYVSPQIWAWRYNRIHTIRKYIDHMAVLFPFEEAIYRAENIPVSFVGHPLIDLVKTTESKENLYTNYELNPTSPIVALFPGSRQQEIKNLLPIMVKAIPLIRQQMPKAQFVLPLASSLTRADLQPFLPPELEIKVIENNTYNILQICNAAIAASGTVTLEIALSKVPMVIIYKTSPLMYWLGRRLIRLKNIGLCNIVGQTMMAKEYLQQNATPNHIASEILQLITNISYREQMIKKMEVLRQHIGDAGGAERVANLALKLIA